MIRIVRSEIQRRRLVVRLQPILKRIERIITPRPLRRALTLHKNTNTAVEHHIAMHHHLEDDNDNTRYLNINDTNSDAIGRDSRTTHACVDRDIDADTAHLPSHTSGIDNNYTPNHLNTGSSTSHTHQNKHLQICANTRIRIMMLTQVKTKQVRAYHPHSEHCTNNSAP